MNIKDLKPGQFFIPSERQRDNAAYYSSALAMKEQKWNGKTIVWVFDRGFSGYRKISRIPLDNNGAANIKNIGEREEKWYRQYLIRQLFNNGIYHDYKVKDVEIEFRF